MMKIYDKESNDLSTQLITELFNQVGMSAAYYTGHLYVIGENDVNDLGAFGVRLHNIQSITLSDYNSIILEVEVWNKLQKVEIKKPNFMVTKSPMDCVYNCMYFCQTWKHEPEYYDDDYEIGGFCMMTGEEKASMFNDICKYFCKKE